MLEEKPKEPLPVMSPPEPRAPVGPVVSARAERGVIRRSESPRIAPQQDPAFVQLTVVVTDSLQRYVSGLQKEHFKVFEDGAEQDISEFFADGALSLGIVLDVRDGNALQIAREAVAQFLRNGPPQDEYYISSSPTGGPAGLWDAVRWGITQLQSAQNRRKALLIVSDRNDNEGTYTADEISTLTNTSDVLIYAVSLTQLPGSALLEALAGHSGGRHFPIADLNDLPGVATKLGVELRNSYFVGYEPRNRSQDGKFRQVQVQIVPPKGISRLFATTRGGYSAPVANRGSLSTSEPTILSDTKGVDFGAYLNELTNRVRANWFYRIPEAARQGIRGRVVVTFRILRDGSIRDLRLLERPENGTLSQAPIAAIQSSAPFSAFPAAFSGDDIVLQLTFSYNER